MWVLFDSTKVLLRVNDKHSRIPPSPPSYAQGVGWHAIQSLGVGWHAIQSLGVGWHATPVRLNDYVVRVYPKKQKRREVVRWLDG